MAGTVSGSVSGDSALARLIRLQIKSFGEVQPAAGFLAIEEALGAEKPTKKVQEQIFDFPWLGGARGARTVSPLTPPWRLGVIEDA